MRNPRDEFSYLIGRGKVLARDVEAIARDSKGVDDNVRLGVGIFSYFVKGYKRTATALGRTVVWGNLQQRYAVLANGFDQWFNDGLRVFRSISVARNKLTRRGNSPTFVRRLAKVKENKRLDTRIMKALGVMEAIAAEDLLYNEDIPDFLRQRREEVLAERRQAREVELLDLSAVAPGLDLIKLTNREELRSHFASHPEVGRMMEGAMDAYGSLGADPYGQVMMPQVDRRGTLVALGSCRRALELLVLELTGAGDWRAGLAMLADGTTKQSVSKSYAFLSKFGGHPGGTPTRRDAQRLICSKS